MDILQYTVLSQTSRIIPRPLPYASATYVCWLCFPYYLNETTLPKIPNRGSNETSRREIWANNEWGLIRLITRTYLLVSVRGYRSNFFFSSSTWEKRTVQLSVLHTFDSYSMGLYCNIWDSIVGGKDFF